MQWGRWIELNLRAMQAAFTSFGRATGSRLLELDGVLGVVNPAVRERSVFNSVVYLDPAALAESYERIADAYADARCAWTVWVPETDTGTISLLESAGHLLDGLPRAMGIELEGVEEPDLTGVDWTDEGDPDEMAAINDIAYGYAPGTWIKGMGRAPEGQITYVAHVDGRPAATVSALDRETDCAVWHVATAPQARGRGLATALMRKVLFDAARRGCETSTLQATKMGAPVYRRCGFDDVCGLQMWESRPVELAAAADPRPPA